MLDSDKKIEIKNLEDISKNIRKRSEFLCI